MTDDWILKGSYFESCNCEAACPCVWFKESTEGDCKLLIAWHIDTGHLNEVALDGLNVALACYAPENMGNGNWQAALYVDDKADEAQFKAITEIFSGQKGGHLAVLMSFVGEVLGVKKASIEYIAKDKNRQVIIDKVADVEIQAINGISGEPSLITNPPLCVVTSHPATVAKSTHYRYQDYDKNWEFSQRNGYYSDFIYQP